MGSRKVILGNGEIYHIYNRGVNKKNIFKIATDYKRFSDLALFYRQKHNLKYSDLNIETRKETIDEFSNSKYVEILAYCLMPNHFHFLIKQIADNGISKYFHKLANGYTRYFNIKHNRVGPLYQGNFKAVRISDDEQLIHTCRYIHVNPLKDYLVENINQYPWSSFTEYKNQQYVLIDNKQVLDNFKSTSDFIEFTLDVDSYQTNMYLVEEDGVE